ncbi:MAG: 5-(carboxyamino)imidazole ribonucleotide synthase, partial [Alphaproteobacteria bacterium]
VRAWDPAADPPSAPVAEHVRGEWGDPATLDRFLRGLDVATLELEGVPLGTAEAVAARVPLHPSPRALAATRDRLDEKRLAVSHGIGTAPFAAVDDEASLLAALREVGAPAVLKRRTEGYDGRGQAVVRDEASARRAWRDLGGAPSVLEGFVAFEREVSIVAVRALDGSIAFYPLVENLHRDGILRRTIAPAPGVSVALEAAARDLASRLLDALGYVGVAAFELFEVGGRLLLNEIAPRVHNSGHWTIEGAQTSQFENHLRAVTGLPLGSTEAVGFSAMCNLIGDAPDPGALLAIPGVHLHLYGKEPRAGRKIGHVTARAGDREGLRESLERVERVIGPQA